MTRPTVSIITPCWNSDPFLEEVYAALRAQTFPDWEWVVADDGSTDRSVEILNRLAVADPRVRVLALPHCGRPGPTRNAALQAAHGEFLAFLDSDDIFLPEKLERQVETLRRTGAEVTYTWVEEFFDPRHGLADLPPKMWPDLELPRDAFEVLALRGNTVCTSGLVISRAVYEAIGGFDEADDMRVGQDYDFLLRIAKRFPIVRTEGIHVRYRIHPNNISKKMPFSKTQAITDRLEKRGDLTGPLRNRYYAVYHQIRGEYALTEQNWSGARRDFRRMFLLEPTRVIRWPALLSLVMPGPLFQRVYTGLKRLQVRLQGRTASPHAMAMKRN
jgi:glycosyltransferase involved in cell wall biosynthesis